MFRRKMPIDISNMSSVGKTGYPYEFILILDGVDLLVSENNDILECIKAWFDDNNIDGLIEKPAYEGFDTDEVNVNYYFKYEDDAILFKITWGEYVKELNYTADWSNGRKI